MNNYLISSDEFITHHQAYNYFKDKKVLFTFGDSWTNNNYLNNDSTGNYNVTSSLANYPYKTWTYRLMERLGYDCVVNIATNGGSNEEIFKWCLDTMCLYEEYAFDKCRIHELGAKEIKVVIEWSSPIRNFGPVNKLFRPFNVSSLPFPQRNDAVPEMYEFYTFYMNNGYTDVSSWHTQIYTIALQKYFATHNIESFYFMGFAPLIEEHKMYTEWDLRTHIEENRFYKLYESANNMATVLNELCNEPVKHKFLVETSMMFIDTFRSFYKTVLKNVTDEYWDSQQVPNPKLFIADGHPNVEGLDIISHEIYKLITSKKND